jgi:hypothetical protein
MDIAPNRWSVGIAIRETWSAFFALQARCEKWSLPQGMRRTQHPRAGALIVAGSLRA